MSALFRADFGVSESGAWAIKCLAEGNPTAQGRLKHAGAEILLQGIIKKHNINFSKDALSWIKSATPVAPPGN